MSRILISFLLLLAPSLTALATIGDWQVYPMVGSYSRIERMGGVYYLLSGQTLMVADSAHLSDAVAMTRMDGLSGTLVSDIVFNGDLQLLSVIYSDGNIDILSADGAVHNLPDYSNHVISGDRTIQGAAMEGEMMYVTTAFGGFSVDMRERVIRSTWYEEQEGDRVALAHCRSVVASRRTDEGLARLLASLDEANGTQVQNAVEMVFRHGRLYTLQGRHHDVVGQTDGRPVISILDVASGQWHNIKRDAINAQLKAFDSNATFQNMLGVEVDNEDPDHIYVCSLQGGIYELQGDSLIGCYNARLNPSEMVSLLQDNERLFTTTTRIGAMMMDEAGYLWFTNGNASNDSTLRCLTPSGKILRYPTPGFSYFANGQYSIIGRLTEAKVDAHRLKWLVRTFHINSQAVCMYYDHGTPEDLSDDLQSMFSTLTDQDGNTYTPNYFYDIKEDRDGAMWLMTSIGPFVIDDQAIAFNNPGSVRRIKIPRNDGTNLADYLLTEVSCRAVLVDPANRKWIATDDAGLYLLSADGMTQLAHFTPDNSPLNSNRIFALAMDESTGVLYVASNGVICAYQTDVLLDVANNDNLYCYPNPVHADYQGDLTIAGFRDGSTITVTDMTHHVVFKEKSEGAVIRWNLEGNDGRRIRPGVYYIDAIESDGKKGGSFKFLVL